MTSSQPPLSHPAILIATGLGLGRLPIAPGTWGSVAALLIALPAWALAGLWGLMALLALALALAPYAIGTHHRLTHQHDHSEIVLDEWIGMWLTLILITPLIPHLAFPPYALWGFAFLAFRVFDILKPWPINLVDRAHQSVYAVVLDDGLAALCAAGLLWAILDDRLMDVLANLYVAYLAGLLRAMTGVL